MINGKTYYQILGVLDDAEDIVIRAAYKVLAQKYHPDKWSGSKEEATQRMSEINQAYATLCDKLQRNEYDRTLDNKEYSSSDESNHTSDFLDSDWDSVLHYYPDLYEITESLRKISVSLAYTFKLTMLEQKLFERRMQVAEELEKKYLERFFGTNKEIIKFAKALISDGQREAAKELNKAVCLLGVQADSGRIIAKIKEKFFSSRDVAAESQNSKDSKTVRAAKRYLEGGDNPYEWAFVFLDCLGIKYRVKGFFSPRYTVIHGGKTEVFSGVELLRYTKSIAENVLRSGQ